MHELRWSDIWILMACYLCTKSGSSARLRDLIAAADWINHAILNYEELSSGLVRLENAGLINVDGDTFAVTCTQKASEIIEPIYVRTRGVMKIWEDIERQMGVPPWKPGESCPHPENTSRYPRLTEEIYKAELAQYSKALKKK